VPLEHPAEHVEYPAPQSRSLQLELPQQLLIYIALASFVGDQIPEVADFGLADTVDASEALLDAVGIPWQVVVHHEVSTLQVEPLAGGICRQKDLYEWIKFE
jgi:hypothetical protein